MRILVTGAGGYIAEALIPVLQEAGHYVIPLCRWHREPHARRYPMMRPRLGQTEQVWFADLAKGFGNLVNEEPPDTVIHLAGRVEISLLPNPNGAHLPPVPGPCDIGALYRDNVLATANVLEYCLKAGVKHLIFASTQAVYGMEEEDCQECGNPAQTPLEHYAASKLAAEQILDIGRKQGLCVTTLRLPGIFGGDRKEGAVYRMCRNAITEGVVKMTAPCPLPINVIHIDDVVNALMAALKWQPPNENWVGGYTTDVSYEEGCSLTILAEEIASLVPTCRLETTDVEQPIMRMDDGYYYLRSHLGWVPPRRKERLMHLLEEIRLESQGT